MAEKITGDYLMYQGKPLVREGTTICYGDMNDKYVLILEIMNYNPETNLPGDILIQVVESKNPSEIQRQGRKKGLNDAFELGCVWLETALRHKD